MLVPDRCIEGLVGIAAAVLSSELTFYVFAREADSECDNVKHCIEQLQHIFFDHTSLFLRTYSKNVNQV